VVVHYCSYFFIRCCIKLYLLLVVMIATFTVFIIISVIIFNALIFNTNNDRTRVSDVYNIVIMNIPADFCIIIITIKSTASTVRRTVIKLKFLIYTICISSTIWFKHFTVMIIIIIIIRFGGKNIIMFNTQ